MMELKFTLEDVSSKKKKSCSLRIHKHGVEILVDGYGVLAASSGEGGIAYFEYYDGVPKIHYNDDINEEDVKTITFEKANEDLREELK